MNTLVAIERTMAMSSAMPAMCGKHSDTQAPHLPCWLNLRRTPSNFGRSLAKKLLMKAKRFPLTNSSGIGLPFSSWSFGLGSNSSSWLGPPAMNRKITFLARPGKWPLRGVSGLTSGSLASARPWLNRLARAIEPMPTPHSWKKCRRVRSREGSITANHSLVMNSSRLSRTRDTMTQAASCGASPSLTWAGTRPAASLGLSWND